MTTSSIFLVVGILAGVLLLILAAGRLLQSGPWRPQNSSARTLILRESIALDPRRRVHLIQCGERQVVVLTGGTQDLVVGWMQQP